MRHDKTATLTRHKHIISPFYLYPASSSALFLNSQFVFQKQLHQSTQTIYLF